MLETVDRMTSSVTECAYDVTLCMLGIVVRNNTSLQLSLGTEMASVLITFQGLTLFT